MRWNGEREKRNTWSWCCCQWCTFVSQNSVWTRWKGGTAKDHNLCVWAEVVSVMQPRHIPREAVRLHPRCFKIHCSLLRASPFVTVFQLSATNPHRGNSTNSTRQFNSNRKCPFKKPHALLSDFPSAVLVVHMWFGNDLRKTLCIGEVLGLNQRKKETIWICC